MSVFDVFAFIDAYASPEWAAAARMDLSQFVLLCNTDSVAPRTSGFGVVCAPCFGVCAAHYISVGCMELDARTVKRLEFITPVVWMHNLIGYSCMANVGWAGQCSHKTMHDLVAPNVMPGLVAQYIPSVDGYYDKLSVPKDERLIGSRSFSYHKNESITVKQDLGQDWVLIRWLAPR
jgi:hypothetical protein